MGREPAPPDRCSTDHRGDSDIPALLYQSRLLFVRGPRHQIACSTTTDVARLRMPPPTPNQTQARLTRSATIPANHRARPMGGTPAPPCPCPPSTVHRPPSTEEVISQSQLSLPVAPMFIKRCSSRRSPATPQNEVPPARERTGGTGGNVVGALRGGGLSSLPAGAGPSLAAAGSPQPAFRW